MILNLLLIDFKLHPKWVESFSSASRRVYISPYLRDKHAAIEIISDEYGIHGLIKSEVNTQGSQVILGKGMPTDLFLMLMVDVFGEDIFEYDE